MRRFSASELLTVWERGAHQFPPVRGLILLAAACPDSQTNALARLPIGVRDARLLELREVQFGPLLTCLAQCPHCKEHLELEFTTREIRVEGADANHPEGAECPTRIERVEADGCEVLFRLPNSADLIALEDAAIHPDPERQLLARCVSGARQGGRDVTVDQLPAGVLAAVERRMAEIDLQAEVQLALDCITCGNRWLSAFDVVSYLWAEIDAWAGRLLRDVHALARAYGWREADILAMTATRRRAYLDLIRA